MKNFILFAITIQLSGSLLFGQGEDNDYRMAPFQLTLVTPIGTNGIYSSNTVNKFSVNLFAGVSAGVDGFEAGGFLNITKDFVDGAQVSGFANIVGDEVNAFQAAGFMNIVDGPFHGFQTAGFINLNRKYTEAAQFAGFINTSDDFKGFQGAGFGNFAKYVDGVQASGFLNVASSVEGAQIAGFGNFAGDVNGAQIAGFINAADDVEGVQIAGFINTAEQVKGVQIAGFINICDSIDGIPIGIINIVKRNGYRRFEIWTNETHFLNFSYRMGVRKFYTIFTGSMRPTITDYRWAYSLGLGTSIALNNASAMEIEGLAYHLLKRNFRQYDDFRALYKFRLNYVYDVAGTLSLFAGPSFNILAADNYENRSIEDLIPGWSLNLRDNRRRVDSWVGFHAGIRF